MWNEGPILINGGGPGAKDVQELHRLKSIPSLTHVLFGTNTLEVRPAHTQGPNFVVLPDGTSINAVSLANRGIGSMCATISFMADIIKIAGKKLVVSIYGDTPEKCATLVDAGVGNGAHIFELDAGCVNSSKIPGEYTPPIGENTQLLRAILASIQNEHPEIELWVKLPAYKDRVARQEAASTLLEFPTVHIAVTCNTVRGRLLKPDGTPVLGVNDGWGGIGGTALHELALENAADFVQFSEGRFGVVGIGGAKDWQTAEPFFARGCIGVGVASAYYEHNDPTPFEKIGEGMKTLFR